MTTWIEGTGGLFDAAGCEPAAHLGTLGGEGLKHSTKILNGQLEEREAEIRYIKHGLAAEFGLTPYGTFRP